MKNLKEIYSNPLTWVLFLAALQVFAAFYIEQLPDKLNNEKAVIERVKSEAQGSSELVGLFQAQLSVIDSKDQKIEAILSFQKTIGGITAIILALHLFSLIRRLRK